MKQHAKWSSMLLVILFVNVLGSVQMHHLAVAQWVNDPSINTPVYTGQSEKEMLASVSDDAGGAMVAWADKRSGGWDIYLQHISALGNVLWDPSGILGFAASSYLDVRMVRDGSGGAILIVRRVVNELGEQMIYAQRVS